MLHEDTQKRMPSIWAFEWWGASFKDYNSRSNHSYLHDTLEVLYKTTEDSFELGLTSIVHTEAIYRFFMENHFCPDNNASSSYGIL